MAQALTVIGKPIMCGQKGCGEPAAVMLRQDDGGDTFSVITLCDSCWLVMRRQYAPLTDHDAQEAIAALTEQIEVR